MNTRFGNFLYGVGLTAACIVILYTIDVIWVHARGTSLLPISGRFVSREDMLITSVIGFAVTLMLWGAGAAARNIVNKSVESRAAAKQPRHDDRKSRRRDINARRDVPKPRRRVLRP